VSRERALRRAAREAEQLKLRQRRARSEARRAGRRRIATRVRGMRPGRTGRIGRRNRSQRAVIVLSLIVGLLLIWTQADSTALSVGLSLLLVLALPVLVVLAFDR
jgi:hypothetical protein